MEAHSKRRGRAAAENRVLDLIDNTLQSTNDPSYHEGMEDGRAMVRPGHCARCATRAVAEGSDWCVGCLAWMLGDSEEDPTTQPEPTPRRSGMDLLRELFVEAVDGLRVQLHTADPAGYGHRRESLMGFGWDGSLDLRLRGAGPNAYDERLINEHRMVVPPRFEPELHIGPTFDGQASTVTFGGPAPGQRIRASLASQFHRTVVVLYIEPTHIDWSVGSPVPATPSIQSHTYYLNEMQAPWLHEVAQQCSEHERCYVWAYTSAPHPLGHPEQYGDALQQYGDALQQAFDEWLLPRFYFTTGPMGPINTHGMIPDRGDLVADRSDLLDALAVLQREQQRQPDGKRFSRFAFCTMPLSRAEQGTLIHCGLTPVLV